MGGTGIAYENGYGVAAGAGSSFLDGSVTGKCAGLAGNAGNGFVTITPQ